MWASAEMDQSLEVCRSFRQFLKVREVDTAFSWEDWRHWPCSHSKYGPIPKTRLRKARTPDKQGGLFFSLQCSIYLIAQVPRIGSPTSSHIYHRQIDRWRERERFTCFYNCLIHGKSTLNQPAMRCCFDIRLTSDWWVFKI